MPGRYKPREIEAKWQERWEGDRLYEAKIDPARPKHYALVMFPYTSGDLHIGHWYNFAPADAHARFKRMQGFNVFMPFGFDAFGLPAENAAIQHGIHPFKWTLDNIRNMERQTRTIGGVYDWSTELATCLPEYYKWNQWFFLKLLEHGLAYRAMAPVNWCPNDQTVLANEQVVGGECERCGATVERRDLEQWFFRITAYADELLDFSEIEWPERVETMQRNWIGRSEGVEFDIPVEGRASLKIPVYTTRHDTIFGMTFVTLAPEHPLAAELTTSDRQEEVRAYQEQARRQTEVERQSTEGDKTGVFIGSYAINPANDERVPIYVSDYVLLSYGTGAIQGVPAHDERDFVFAKAHGLPIPVVVAPPGWDGGDLGEAYVEPGTMVNSGQFDGLPSEPDGKEAIADWLVERGVGRRKVNYRLRDWLISRQRYWGTPIPVIYCSKCGAVPVPEQDLPVKLPEDAEFKPTGESPLKLDATFVNAACPRCGEAGRRETDTMDTFVDSSWYFLRYVSPTLDEPPGFDIEKALYWMPVDQYMGGVEHAVLHLLYARFFTKALRDMGYVKVSEPFKRLYNQGIILGPDGHRMSKSRGNVVNPDDYVQKMGADTVRCYLMFIGPWDSGGPWEPKGISGVQSFLNRVWTLATEPRQGNARTDEAADRDLLRLTHQTVRDVSADYERFRFNTMLSKLMTFSREMLERRARASDGIWNQALESLLLMLAPAAPHLTEELWSEHLGKRYSIHEQPWPVWDARLAAEDELTVPVTVNGKPRGELTIPAAMRDDEAGVVAQALELPRVKAMLDGAVVQRVKYVPGRIVNLVVG